MFLSTPVSLQSRHIEAATALKCRYHHIKISLNPRSSFAHRYLFRYISWVGYDVILQSMYCDSIGTLLHFRRYLDPPDPNMATSSRPGTIIPRTKNNCCWLLQAPATFHRLPVFVRLLPLKTAPLIYFSVPGRIPLLKQLSRPPVPVESVMDLYHAYVFYNLESALYVSNAK